MESAFAPGTKEKVNQVLKEIWESYHPKQEKEKDTTV